MTLTSRWIQLATATTAIAALGISQALAQANAPKVGSAAPGFSMVDLNGKNYTNRNLVGKVVLLDFWATWCGPCKMASPIMQKLSTKYGKQGLVVIGANTFEENSKKMASGYVAEHKYTYTMTVDNTKLAESWGIKGIPQFYVLDKKGVVRVSKSGYGPALEQELDTLIAKLVRER